MYQQLYTLPLPCIFKKLILHMIGNTWRLFLWIWFVSLNMRHCSSVSIPANDIISVLYAVALYAAVYICHLFILKMFITIRSCSINSISVVGVGVCVNTHPCVPKCMPYPACGNQRTILGRSHLPPWVSGVGLRSPDSANTLSYCTTSLSLDLTASSTGMTSGWLYNRVVWIAQQWTPVCRSNSSASCFQGSFPLISRTISL